MSRLTWIIMVALAMMLAACGGGQTAAPAAKATEAPKAAATIAPAAPICLELYLGAD